MGPLDGRCGPAYPSAVRVLGLDTSTPLGTVAVTVDGELRAELSARVAARHGESVLALVTDVLARGRVDKAEIDLVAVGIGPGSFTGTRVGVATAKGLALALDRPVVGVVTLRAIATAAPGDRVATLVDAHKGEVFVAAYRREGDQLIGDLAPDHVTPEHAAEVFSERPAYARCGSGLRRYPDAFAALPGRSLPPLFDAPRGAVIASLGEARFTRSGPDDNRALEPLYVRPSDAKKPEGPGPGS